MRLLSSVLLLGTVFGMCEAGVLGIREASAQSCSPSTVWSQVTTTIIQVQHITVTPPAVTILQQDPNAILSSKAQTDSIQVSDEVLEAPVSGKPLPPQVFSHTIVVSGFVATELSNIPGNTVYYLSQTASPQPSITPRVTTITVSPIPLNTSHKQRAQVNTTDSAAADSIVHSAFTIPSGGWNGSTSAGSSLFGPATAVTGSGPSGTSSFAPLTSSTAVQSASTDSTWTSTVTEIATVYATIPATSAPGYDIPPVYGYGTNLPVSDDLEKRQTCVMISATIGGQLASWCNNWAGNSKLTFTSWETTTTPSFIPGIGTITPQNSQPATSITGAVTIQTSTPTATGTSLSPSATNCGESGPFQVTFDDLIPSGSDDAHPMAPFIQNPYDYLEWGDGWAYVPPPNDPFPPESGDRLAQWDPSINNTVLGSPNAGSIPPGSIGALSRNSSHYWFSADSAFVGCDNAATNLSQICDFVATAYQWNVATQSEVVVATQHFHVAPCPDNINCQLTKINFNYLFYKMSTLQFYANVQGQVTKFWMDTISMNWYDDSCEAGLARIGRQA